MTPRLSKMSALLEASGHLLAEATLAGLVKRIIDAAMELTGASLGACCHESPDGDLQSVTLAEMSIGDGSRRQRVSSQPIFRAQMELLRHGGTLRLTESELQRQGGLLALPPDHPPLRGLLAAALTGADGKTCGMIAISDKCEGGEFTAEDEALLVQLAAMASLGMRHIEARELAQQRAAELDAIFDAVAEPVIIYDLQGRPVKANPAAVRACGQDPASDVHPDGLHLALRLLGRDGRAIRDEDRPVQRALLGQRVVQEPLLLGNHVGERIVQKTASPVMIDGRICGVVALLHDVTERQQMEEALRGSYEELERHVQQRTEDLNDTVLALQSEVLDRRRAEEELRLSEERYRVLFEAAPVGIGIVDRHETIRTANRALSEILGYSVEELCNSSIVRHFSDASLRDEAWQTLRQQGILRDGQMRLRRKDGREFFAIVSAQRVHVVGSEYLLLTVRDVTERRRLEAEVLRTSEMERQRIGHDLHDVLGQNLTGVAFMTKALEQELEERCPPLAGSAAAIGRLVKDSISLTRLLARGLSPVGQSADSLMLGLKEMALGVQEMYGLKCEFHCPQPVMLKPGATATHLYRIAQEAVNNAVKHSGAKEVRIALTAGQHGTRLQISDNGRGLPSNQGQRKGLGLRIISYRCRTIGASLEINPAPDGGVVVTCLLPHACAGE